MTSVIGGNCGFTLAPLKEADADYTRRMMAQVEGMPLAALEEGVPWTWESFGEYLDRLEDGARASTPGSWWATAPCGGTCSATTSPASRHPKRARARSSPAGPVAGGRWPRLVDDPVAAPTSTATAIRCRAAGRPRTRCCALCEVVGRYDGTSLGADHRRAASAAVQRRRGRAPGPDESATAHRPLNWNVLGVEAADPGRIDHQLRPSRRARELGGRVVALTMPVFADNNMSFLTFCAMWLIPGWRDMLDLTRPRR